MFVSGCSQQVRPSPKVHVDSTRIFDKNYELGQKLIAYVGQPIIKVKDYKVKNYKSEYMKPSSDFVTSGGMGDFIKIYGKQGENYKTGDTSKIDGVEYTVVFINHPDGGRRGLLISSKGKVHSKILAEVPDWYGRPTGQFVTVLYSFDTLPEDVVFTSVNREEIDVNAGYMNYELIFGGTDGKSITISYREYTSKDMARPAFYQNLVYEVGKDKIRFKDTVIKIHSIDSEQVVYTVLSDGLTK